MWTTSDGYILRLPRSGLIKILSRLQDSGLNDLIRSNHNGNVLEGIVSSIGHLAKNARRTDNVRHAKSHQKYSVFTAQVNGGKYLILARPLTIRQNAIVFVSYEPGAVAHEVTANGNAKAHIPTNGRHRPDVLKSAAVLQQEANKIFFRAYPRLKGKAEVHHRIPLEWRRLFPKMDPNRLSNLQGLRNVEQRRKVKNLWKAFQRLYRRLRRSPTSKEVWQHVRVVERLLFSISLEMN